MKKLILLLSLVLTAFCACLTRVDPEDGNLPPAKVGQPYHQLIHLHGSIPRTIWIDIGPEDNGLSYRFLNTVAGRESGTNSGDVIEISGVPKDTNDSEIVIFIQGYGHQDKQDAQQRFQKSYIIKLIPDKNHPHAQSVSQAQEQVLPSCVVIEQDSCRRAYNCR